MKIKGLLSLACAVGLLSLSLASARADGIKKWLSSDTGSVYADTGITTYYVSASPLIMLNPAMLNAAASEAEAVFTIASQIKLNSVSVGENAIRIADNGSLNCLFNIKNNTAEKRSITVVIATYTERKSLHGLSHVSLTLEASEERSFELDYVFNTEYEVSGKIMFWDSLVGMVPLRTAIDFNQTNGVNAYYYDLDNRLLQVDKANGVSLLYTYDKTGNLLTKAVRR